MSGEEISDGVKDAIEHEIDLDLNRRLIAIAGILHGLPVNQIEHLLSEALRNVKACTAFDGQGPEFQRAIDSINARLGLADKMN